ncbi:MAG: restriction endonuclease, partial [Clostridia bacterium]|nr:restriction endonuclease [Clostridia bacterium]
STTSKRAATKKKAEAKQPEEAPEVPSEATPTPSEAPEAPTAEETVTSVAQTAPEALPQTEPKAEEAPEAVEISEVAAAPEAVTAPEEEHESALPFTSVAVFERTESADEIDVSGTPKDTFVFFSPSQLAQMEAEKKAEAEESPVSEALSEVSVTVEAVEVPEAEEDPGIVTEDAPEETVEEVKAEEAEDEPSLESEQPPRISVSVVSEDTDLEAEASVAEKRSTRRSDASAQRGDRRRDGGKRNDPHERDVMDKERVCDNLIAILRSSGELERRILIEETMKTIPLTEEERQDNHPTSLSNRVRSVIGSMLAEHLASGKIVASGRKLTLSSALAAEEILPDEEIVSDEVTEEITVTAEEEASSAIDAPETDAEPASEEESEAEMEIEIIETPVEESPVEETVAAPEIQISVEAPSAEEAPEEPSESPVVSESREYAPREYSQRRTRQARGDRRASAPAASTVTAVLITEEEIERVILNAVRRNSATKNDLFAVLKHVYVEPNRLSKEEENRIYGVAGNVLQKLVNRGTLQNSDGRYLQKPSQRILNPGRTPGAYSTGNVEARFITELNRQSGDFFEQFAARLLEKYFEMSNVRVDASYVVGGSDDNGIDIMIETTDWLGYKERVFVQAKKRATQPVTLKEVREFYGALCAEEGTRGVFITTSNFCMEASKMIGKIRNLIAIDKRKLFALAEHCEVGLVRDEEGRLLLDENLFLDYDV